MSRVGGQSWRRGTGRQRRGDADAHRARGGLAGADAIFGRIAPDNLEAALRVYDAIQAEFHLLASHPGAGPSCEFPEPDLADLHFWPVKKYRNYLVIYRPLPDGAEVVRVIHAAIDMRRAFRGG